MTDMSDQIAVTHDAKTHRFEVRTSGAPAFLRYAIPDGAMDLIHTEVPTEYEGHGYGAALAKAALDYARDEGLHVIPTCPFVRVYLKRHPEYAALVAKGPDRRFT